MKKTDIINCYIKNLDKKGSSKKLQDERRKRLIHFFETIWKDEENWNTITYKDVEKYIKKLKIQFNSKVTTLAGIKSFIRFCNLQKQLLHLNSDWVFLPKMEIKEARYLTEEEIGVVLKKAEEQDLRLKTAINLLANTWARIHEVCKITREQIKWAILVQENYQISIIWKRKIQRPLFISKKTYDLCVSLLKTHRENTVIGLKKGTLAAHIRKFSKELNIKFTAHAFRHTFITDLAKQWASIYKISKLAGHTNINTTNRYLHSADSELSCTVNLLSYRE